MRYNKYPNIDANFIANNESPNGEYILEPYIPHGEQSGITIGHGVDFGQWQGDEGFKKLMDDIGLHSVYKQFLGHKGDTAAVCLGQHTDGDCSIYAITEYQARALTHYTHESIFDDVADSLENHNMVLKQLPYALATVVGDLSVQYGPNLSVRMPNFWNQLINKDYVAMIENLRNFGDKYPSRRNREADLLASSGIVEHG